MTVSSTVRQAGPFVGDALTTVFPFGFKCFSKSDLVATLTVIASGVQSTLVLDSDYTVALNADQDATPGGSITYNPAGVPMPATNNLTITSAVPQSQTMTLTIGGGFFPTVISTALDRIVILIQELALRVTRGLYVAIGDTAPSTLPSAAARALKALWFDAAGNPIASSGSGTTPVSAAMAPVVASATLAAARTALGVSAGQGICQGRLTLTTAVPVTTADVTGAAAVTIFFTPYEGNQIATYNGATWGVSTFAEKSIAVPATTATMYDVFIVDGTLALEVLAWTNDTTRATLLTTQDGVLVKTGATTRRYLGSFRTAAVAGQTEDSAAKRYVWNYYNRVQRKLKAALETADTWLYSTAVLRQMNANAANQLDYICGVAEDALSAQMVHSARSDQAAGTVSFTVGIGIDSTTAIHTDCLRGVQNNIAANIPSHLSANIVCYPGIGRHTVVPLEYVTAVGNTTWVGDNGQPAQSQTGISGMFPA